MLDPARIHGIHRTPDAKPRVAGIPGDEDTLVGAPLDPILTILDPDTVRKPSGAQIGLDGPLKAQRSRTIRRVLEKVLDDEAGPAIRTELKALDIDSVQHPAIDEAVAVWISDHLRAIYQQKFLIRSHLREARLEGVDQLDRRQPQSGHLALHVLAHVGKIAILRPDQVRPVARGDIRAVTAFLPCY